MNPAVDPWVITEREKLKYQDQFKALHPQDGFVTGQQAKGFFLQSQLPPLILGQIWALADTDSDGKMNINEFSIACKLISLKLRGVEVPKVLPPTLLTSLVTPTLTPTGSGAVPVKPIIPAALPGAVPAVPGVVPPAMPAMAAVVPPTAAPGVPTVMQPLPGMVPPGIPTMVPKIMPVTGSMPVAIPPGIVPAPVPVVGAVPVPVAVSVPGAVPASVPAGKVISPPIEIRTAVPAVTPPHSNPPSRNMSISERAASIESPQAEWAIQAATKRKYTQVFNAADRTRSGYLTGVQARGILVQSKLPQTILAQIWSLSDLDCDGKLSCDEFILAMFLCDKAMHGEKIPSVLPPDWIPPSFRKSKSRQGSVSGVGSRAGSTTSSRHASVSSQGTMDGDPAAGLPQTSFEDKRKENFDKGQAELDRRRKLLQDQQRKEKEERERKEREEAEKRERARLEAERKQQEELERQLQKQREIELEREEQRKRELEAKEAARKELEKQRQMEWEQARIAEMNAQKEREQERVLKQKAHNTQLNVELSTLNEKIKDLSQKICDTRAGVTNVKSVIDGMRSQRDSSMAEMAQLKARIKEQNAKLLQLTQERAKWDAKIKSAGIGMDPNQQEQMNAAFANKQLIIKQLKDKVENIQKEIEAKKEDINANDLQVSDVKGELSALIAKCEELYADYDKQRTQVLELKYNKKNDNVVATSAWESSASAWSTSVDHYSAVTETVTAANAVTDSSGSAPEGFVKYRAVYEFNARNADEITFAPGDIIFVPLEQNAEPGWLAGEINGQRGWFPETYVEKIEESAVPAPAQIENYTLSNAYSDNTSVPVNETLNGEAEYYIAAYPYESNEAGDLSFGAGEMIMVIKKEGEWWTGTIGNRTGMFPSNYVQKADVGTTSEAALPATVTSPGLSEITALRTPPAAASINEAEAFAAFETKEENITNGNTSIAQTTYESSIPATTQDPIVESNDLTARVTDAEAAAVAAAFVASKMATPVGGDETRTNEDLDTEVSQINTQSTKNQAEPAESYSRPMSRTSTMTPGMRAKRSEIAQVIAPYKSESAEQLTLVRGQLIMIRKKTDSGWWEGELQAKGRRRQIGWFPATYVKILQGGRNSGRNTPVSGSRIEMTETILDKVIALYPYKAQNDDELTFEKDDIISVLGRDEPEWWRGELNGLTGLFPSNYVGPFVTSGNV